MEVSRASNTRTQKKGTASGRVAHVMDYNRIVMATILTAGAMRIDDFTAYDRTS
jgi:hypothetical protein